MKRRIVALIMMMFFVNSICNAQIQRNFFDFTLGLTTKKEVSKYFKSEGKKCSKRVDNSLCVQDVKFGGYNWPYAIFSFYNEKLYKVGFFDSGENTTEESLKTEWISLKTTISLKYESYLDQVFSSDYIKTFDDDTTTLLMLFQNIDGRGGISLIYSDDEMEHAVTKAEKDEL